MAKDWRSISFLESEQLWEFIDQEAQKLSLSLEDQTQTSELYKLLLMGRREMLDSICTYLMQNENMLQDIILTHGVLSEEQLELLNNQDYCE